MATMRESSNKRRILFVCTGNVFRSLAAEYCLKKFLSDKKLTDTIVSSAGTVAKIQPTNPATFGTLEKLGIDASAHKIKKLTKKDLIENDMVIVMAKNHIDFIKEKFGFENVVLFNYLSSGKDTPVLDVGDVVEDVPSNQVAIARHIKKTILHINKNIPKLYAKLDSYLLFSDLISGRLKKNWDSRSYRFTRPKAA